VVSARLRALSSALGVARCGPSAGCVLCVLWAMSAAVLGVGVPCGGKHIIIIDIVITNNAKCMAYPKGGRGGP